MADKLMKFVLEEMPEKDIEWVQLIRTGVFPYGYDDEFEITSETLREFKLNFDRKARRVDLAVDYYHDSYSKAAGWFKEVELRENDNQLWIRVEWTKEAKEMILDKQLRYISAEFHLKYKDDETGTEYGATLYGAGLTNRPHVKDMQPIFSENKKNKENNMPKKLDFNEILDSVSELSEDEKMQLGEKLGFNLKASEEGAEVAKKLSESEKEKEAAEKKLSEKDVKVKALTETVDKIQAQLAEEKKKGAFDKMLASGTVVEAQREAYMKGDMTKFAENAVAGINLDGSGSGKTSEDDEQEVAVAKFKEAAEKLVKEEGITFAEAAKRVKAENPSLYKAAA